MSAIATVMPLRRTKHRASILTMVTLMLALLAGAAPAQAGLPHG